VGGVAFHEKALSHVIHQCVERAEKRLCRWSLDQSGPTLIPSNRIELNMKLLVVLLVTGDTHTLVTRVIKDQYVLTHIWNEVRRKYSEMVTTERVGPTPALAIDSQGALYACSSIPIPGGSQLTYACNDRTGWTSEVSVSVVGPRATPAANLVSSRGWT
jgi:hypothetical protein